MGRARNGLRRTGRGLLCGSACLSLGAAGHVAAGGRLPGPGALALILVALTCCGAALSAARRRFDVTVLALGAIQFALHVALHYLSTPSAMPAGGGRSMPGTHTGAHVGGPSAVMHDGVCGHMETRYASGAGPGMASGAGWPAECGGASHFEAMAAGHALAIFGTALCVIHGERALLKLAALLLPVLWVFAIPSLPRPRARRRAFWSASQPLLGVLLSRSRPLRGPPMVACT